MISSFLVVTFYVTRRVIGLFFATRTTPSPRTVDFKLVDIVSINIV